MSSPLGSKLAQLANARKKAEEAVLVSPEDIKRKEDEDVAANVKAIHLTLVPHVNEFNAMVDASEQIAMETTPSRINIKQKNIVLLALDITLKGAAIKRPGGRYSSDDYFTLGTAPDGSLTFRNYSAEVAKPLTGTQYAEIILMEALGLNQ